MIVAVSAVEQAVWDCIGKHLGLPLYQILGGSVRDAIPCYATLSAGLDSHEPADLAEEAVRVVNEGFAAVKVSAFRELKGSPTVGPLPLPDGNSLEIGRKRLLAVREAIGPDVGLIVECDFALDRATLLSLIPFLKRVSCLWIEAPLAWDDSRGLAELRRSLGMRIASGEVEHGRLEFQRLIEDDSVDILQPDVKWAGGILEVRKIAAWAEVHQISIALHNNSGPIATAVSAHLSIVLPNAVILEIPSRHPAWEMAITGDDPIVVNGRVERERLTRAFGLGIELDESCLSDAC